VRLVCSYETTPEQIAAFPAALDAARRKLP